MRAVNRCAVHADAELCCLNDRILFGVHGIAELVACSARDVQLASEAFAFLLAAFDPASGAVVSRGDDALIAGDYRADLSVLLKARIRDGSMSR